MENYQSRTLTIHQTDVEMNIKHKLCIVFIIFSLQLIESVTAYMILMQNYYDDTMVLVHPFQQANHNEVVMKQINRSRTRANI